MAKRTRKKASNDEKAKKFLALVKKTDTEKPAPKDVAALRQALEKDERLWRKTSDLNHMAHAILLKKFPAEMRESIYLRLKAMREELGYEAASDVERLLIEQIETCWLNLHITQVAYAMRIDDEGWEKHMDAAQKRYLKALATLTEARRRRLGPKTLQVNIGAQQVNVAGNLKAGKKRAVSSAESGVGHEPRLTEAKG